MPHCVILYTPNIERKTDMAALCRKLADAMMGILDESGKQVFPSGGTRVYAYPAAHYAVSDGGKTGLQKAVQNGLDARGRRRLRFCVRQHPHGHRAQR